jgi:hypothetical protein
VEDHIFCVGISQIPVDDATGLAGITSGGILLDYSVVYPMVSPAVVAPALPAAFSEDSIVSQSTDNAKEALNIQSFVDKMLKKVYAIDGSLTHVRGDQTVNMTIHVSFKNEASGDSNT